MKAKGYQKTNRHRNLNELVFAANSYEKCELTQAETKCKTRGKQQLSVRQNLEQKSNRSAVTSCECTASKRGGETEREP